MLWLAVAILAHGLNAVVFVVDKGILGSGGGIGRPAKYAAYSGLVAALAGGLLFFSWRRPDLFIASWSLALGALWVLALWLFFKALKYSEPSRVVPLAGASVPVFTWVFAVIFLGERLGVLDSLAVLFLILGGGLLSLRLKGTRGMPLPAVILVAGSGAAFAGYFAGVDYVYVRWDPFLAAFAYTRIGVGVVALGLLGLFARNAPRLRSAGGRSFGGQARQHSRQARPSGVAAAFVVSKLLGAGALLLQNWAIDLASVTRVNALQGTQYIAVLALAAFVSVRWPRVFREELASRALWQKVGGILLVSGGLGMLVAF